MGKDHCADVAALHHHSAAGAERLLQAHHPGANGREDAYARGCFSHRRAANDSGYVFAIQQDAVLLIAGLQTNRGSGGKAFQATALIQRQSRPEGLQGEGTIHGAGFKIEQAKMPRQMPRDGALSRPGRSIDGDDCLPRRLRFGHPRFFVPCLERTE